MARTLNFEPATVLTTTEARTGLPKLAAGFRERGIDAGVVFFGPQRRPDGAIVPAALLEALAPYLEDIVIAERVRARLAEDTGERVTLEDLDAKHDWSAKDIAAETDKLRAELGLR